MGFFNRSDPVFQDIRRQIPHPESGVPDHRDLVLDQVLRPPAGVLSEDLVYDQITAVRDAAFRMLDLSADILKNRI